MVDLSGMEHTELEIVRCQLAYSAELHDQEYVSAKFPNITSNLEEGVAKHSIWSFHVVGRDQFYAQKTFGKRCHVPVFEFSSTLN